MATMVEGFVLVFVDLVKHPTPNKSILIPSLKTLGWVVSCESVVHEEGANCLHKTKCNYFRGQILVINSYT